MHHELRMTRVFGRNCSVNDLAFRPYLASRPTGKFSVIQLPQTGHMLVVNFSLFNARQVHRVLLSLSNLCHGAAESSQTTLSASGDPTCSDTFLLESWLMTYLVITLPSGNPRFLQAYKIPTIVGLWRMHISTHLKPVMRRKSRVGRVLIGDPLTLWWSFSDWLFAVSRIRGQDNEPA